MAKLWRNSEGKIIRSGGVVQRCADCPCGGNDCVYCDPSGSTPVEFSITISGVTGCNGRCSTHNLTVLLPQTAPCTWSASFIFPQPDEGEGHPCESLNGNVLGSAEIILTGEGEFELRIFDEVIGGQLVEIYWYGTFYDRCDAISTTASGLTVDVFGSMNFACPEEGCEDWCDWSGASVSISAL